MTINRLPDWRDRLSAVVLDWQDKPFRWGTTDCVCFASACLVATVGRDLLEAPVGRYASRLGAMRRVYDLGAVTVLGAVSSALDRSGCPQIASYTGKPGDIGVTIDEIVAVRWDIGWIARDEAGAYKLVAAHRAWSVG